MNNILNSVKAALGITEDYNHFNPQVLMHINSVFTILDQIGIGPVGGYVVTSDSTWDDFFTDDTVQQELVKSYVYLRVRLLFDPPTTSFVLDSMKRQIEEYEWRLNVLIDPKPPEVVNHGS